MFDSTLQRILAFYQNPLTRAARTADGRDVIIRVLAVGDEGKDHVEILQSISHGVIALLHSSHQLPLLGLIEIEDITLGVFPKAGGSLTEMYGSWAKPSIGDVLDIILQCIEVSPHVLKRRLFLRKNLPVPRLSAFYARHSSGEWSSLDAPYMPKVN